MDWKIVDGKQRKFPVCVGREHNVVVAVEMSKYLIATTLRLAAQFSRERAIRLNFEKGCGFRLVQRLNEMRQQLQLPKGDGSGLPALYASEQEIIARYYKETGLDLTETSARRHKAGLGYMSGHVAGGSINLGAQVGAGRATLLK